MLLSYDAIVAVSAAPHGDAGDVVVTAQRTNAYRGGGARVEEMVPLDQGLSRFVTLRMDVQSEFRRCGNNHWGDLTDLKALSDALNVGVCMFCDRLQLDGQKFLYNACLQRGDFPFFVGLWWLEPVHFRVGEFRLQPGAPYRCFWSRAALPLCLREHYNACNPQAPVGQPESGDLS